MQALNRTALFILMALMLASCGYRPLYGTHNGQDVATDLSMISIDEVSSREAQMVRNKLLSGMRPVGQAGETTRYRLTLDTNISDIVLVNYGVHRIKRSQYRLKVNYTLLDKSTGQVLKTGNSYSVVSYDRVFEPFADMQAQKNASERAAAETSSDIRTKLAAFMATRSS